jgi:HEAT repeat protein
VEDLVRQSAANPGLRSALETSLVQILGTNSTYEAKRFACHQLAVIGSDASLPAIAELLQRNDTVGIACLALSTHPSSKANAILRDALLALRGAARVQVVNTLGDRHDPEAAPTLANLAGHPDAPTAEAAIAALGKIATQPAVDALAELRKSDKPSIARAALLASLEAADRLAASGDRKAAVALYAELLQPAYPAFVRRAALEALLRLEGGTSAQRILGILHGDDASLKPVAIAAVRDLKERDTSARFARELPKLKPAEQALLLEALAGRGDPAARTAVNDALASDDAVVRQAAFRCVARWGDATSVPLLARALAAAKTPEERDSIEQALISLPGGTDTDRAIIAQLRQKTAEPKQCVVSALARRGSRLAVPVLLAETESSDPAVVKVAFQGLGRLATAEDLPTLLDKLIQLKVSEARTEAEGAVAQTIARVADVRRRTDVVCAALSHVTEVETRCSLLGLLPTCAGGRALEALQAAREESNARIREAAIRALAEWPDATAWETLAEIYRHPDSEAYRVIALRGLVRLAEEDNPRFDAHLLERYRLLFDGAKTDDDRKLILGALSGAAHPDALSLALPLVSNPALKAEAELAVKKIAEAIKAQHPQAAQAALQKLK